MKIRDLLLMIGLMTASSIAIGQDRFMSLPFADPTVKLQNAPLYFDGDEHWGAGFAFDFVKGQIDNSSTWSAFDVHAAASGVAIRTYQDGYGDFVLIRHDEADSLGRRYFTLYAHLSSIESDIPRRSRYDTNFSSWKRLERGEKIGIAGATGKVVCASSNCIHLHFEVFRGGYFQNPIDPYDVSTVLNKFGRSAYPPLTFPGCGADHNWSQCPPILAEPPNPSRECSIARGDVCLPPWDFSASAGPPNSLFDLCDVSTYDSSANPTTGEINISLNIDLRSHCGGAPFITFARADLFKATTVQATTGTPVIVKYKYRVLAAQGVSNVGETEHRFRVSFDLSNQGPGPFSYVSFAQGSQPGPLETCISRVGQPCQPGGDLALGVHELSFEGFVNCNGAPEPCALPNQRHFVSLSVFESDQSAGTQTLQLKVDELAFIIGQ